ncbi:bifunctional DNA primase/polymerase [Pseudonocardia sp. CA-107938]|uniref:bifunctional DNA primase/polymerase n=1 Tax=Pseudonocardia sp. CA-107938 TaxID=3240021 RepID=UPI003D91519A
MSGWDSYRAVYGAELRAAAREISDHGWPVVELDGATVAVVTGTVLDFLEVPATLGRLVCARLRADGLVVPVAATPTGAWYYPVASGAELPLELATLRGVTLHTGGATVLMPPSTVPDGWVHWRVSPALSGYVVPDAEPLLRAAVAAAREAADSMITSPGAQRPAGMVVVGMRS